MVDFTKPIHGEDWTLMAKTTAMQLKPDNQIEVVNWCSGQIKGTKLKPKNRVIHIYCRHRDQELEAKCGDWIVRFDRFNGSHCYFVFPDGMFQYYFNQGIVK